MLLQQVLEAIRIAETPLDGGFFGIFLQMKYYLHFSVLCFLHNELR